jgi:hypothetical protein
LTGRAGEGWVRPGTAARASWCVSSTQIKGDRAFRSGCEKILMHLAAELGRAYWCLKRVTRPAEPFT